MTIPYTSANSVHNHREILLGCVFASGFSSLAYEVLWARLFALACGATLFSMSTVLSAFFGGLAIGSFLARQLRLAGARESLFFYACIELGIGTLALLLSMSLHSNAIPSVLAGIHHEQIRILAGALITSALVVPVATLMGATLPILTVCLTSTGSLQVGPLIYAVNTFGACAGVYLVTYHLIPASGVSGALLVSVVLNVAVGVTCLVLRTSVTNEPMAMGPVVGEFQGKPVSDSGASRSSTAVVNALALLSGFAFLSLEVIWARVFSLVFRGTIYGLSVVLIVFLLGSAIGSLHVARRPAIRRQPLLAFLCCQVLALMGIGMVSLLLEPLSVFLRQLGTIEAGALVGQHAQLVVTLVVLAPATVCSGASFSLLLLLHPNRSESHGMGSLLAANTVGCIAGALVTGFALIPNWGSAGASRVVLCIVTLTAILAASQTRARVRILAFGTSALVALSVIFYGELTTHELLSSHEGSGGGKLIYFNEGTESTVAVYERPMSRLLTLNSLPQGSRWLWGRQQNTESVLLAFAPLLHTSDAEDALVIGLGAGTTVEVLARSHLRRIDVVEIEPRVVDALKVIYEDENPIESAKVRVYVGDARNYLMRGSTLQYDLISSMAAHPWVSPGLYTQEFFQLLLDHLTPTGVSVVWFGNGNMDQTSIASLFRAFCAVFNHYIIYYVPEVGAYYLIGSPRRLSIDVKAISSLQQLVGDDPVLADPFFLPTRVYASGGQISAQLPDGPVNTDDSAFVEVHAPLAKGPALPLVDFFPRQYLDPMLIPRADRREVIIEVLEHLLGSPFGALPERLLPKNPYYYFGSLPASRLLSASEGILSKSEIMYFRGRIELAEGRNQEARELLMAASGSSDVAVQAMKFVSHTYPPWSRERILALASSHVSTDVVLDALDTDYETGLNLAKELKSDTETLGDFLAAAAGVRSAGQGDRELFVPALVRALLRSNRIGVLALAETIARADGRYNIADALAHRRHTNSVEKARELLAVLESLPEDEIERAPAALMMALRLDPSNRELLRSLLDILPKLGQTDRDILVQEIALLDVDIDVSIWE